MENDTLYVILTIAGLVLEIVREICDIIVTVMGSKSSSK